MASQTAQGPYSVHILEKKDYTKQHIVEFNEPLPPLAPSSVRVQTSLISLTTNNITYARLGHVPMFNWWDASPLPFKEGEYSNSEKYGRVNAWGIGTVIESTAEFVPVGTKLFGYHPIGTLPADKVVKISELPGMIDDISEHRKSLFPGYNQYYILGERDANSDKAQAYFSLFCVFFETSYHINRLSFSWEPSVGAVNPLGLEVPPPLDTWTKERADLKRAVVVILSASGKTALSLAYALRFLRPESERPRAVFAVGSEASRSFTESTKLYDGVLNYDLAKSDSSQVAEKLGLSAQDKIVLVDFGGRGDSFELWRESLRSISNNVPAIRMAESVPEHVQDIDEVNASFGSMLDAAKDTYVGNAFGMRNAGMALLGTKTYMTDFRNAFEGFMESHCVQCVKPMWGEGTSGATGVEGGWTKLTSGHVDPASGLVFRLT
ncbi:hypothetical protein NA57DRAFT_75700 [Rhizodiscina lignyota]|uniref:Uncharacterized protein n=1 Tax=Rhizodiscina lignyota TaxID=1504668 RepID=A0A9P4M622_9PEZI|nr:hypothetical protein NA57DRAFT_75700 [Rhizodiscina lignyota]